MKSIRQQIIEAASVSFGVSVADLNPGAPWSELSDSLEVVELVMAVEEHFGIELPEEEVEAMKCLDDLIWAVERRLGDDPGDLVAIKPRYPRGRPSIRNSANTNNHERKP
jgi:acyl carrier protein